MTSEDRTGCLRNMKKRQKPRLQLLCFPHAGASAEAYRAWLNHLPDDVELWAVEPPGRAFRCTEAPWRTMEGLVEEVGSSVAEVASRPFMMFGHSLGALQAFETVRWLRERKLPLPQQLCVSAFRGPHLSPRTAGMSALPDQEFVNELIVRYGGANHVLEDPDLRAVALPALRSDFELLESYPTSRRHLCRARSWLSGGTLMRSCHQRNWRAGQCMPKTHLHYRCAMETTSTSSSTSWT